MSEVRCAVAVAVAVPIWPPAAAATALITQTVQHQQHRQQYNSKHTNERVVSDAAVIGIVASLDWRLLATAAAELLKATAIASALGELIEELRMALRCR